MKVYQLINVDGEHIGLFMSERNDVEKVTTDIENAIEVAKGDSEIYNEVLEEKNILPVWAEEVYTKVI